VQDPTNSTGADFICCLEMENSFTKPQIFPINNKWRRGVKIGGWGVGANTPLYSIFAVKMFLKLYFHARPLDEGSLSCI
jgi:hypothetical protein